MNQARNDVRLSMLPQVGTDIRVHLKQGTRTYLNGRITFADETVVIDVIKKPREAQKFPAITKTIALELNEIVRISFRNLDGRRISFLGDSNYWLNGIPKSGKGSVLVLCREKDRAVDIGCGWVEYHGNKIHVREVIDTIDGVSQLKDHERFLSEIIMVFVSDAEESKVCVRITQTK